MKTRKLFYTASKSLFALFLFVSCTSNEETMNDTLQLEKSGKNTSQAFIPTVARGRLLFENNSPFKLDARLTVLGGIDHVTADEKFQGLTSIREGNTTIFDDFKTVNIPQAEVLTWNSSTAGSYSGSDANDIYGLFVNDVDNTDGYFVKWIDFKGENFKGTITSTIFDPVTNTFPSEDFTIRGMALGFPQNEGEVVFQQLPQTAQVFQNEFPLTPQYLHFSYTTEIFPNGDTHVVFSAVVNTTP